MRKNSNAEFQFNAVIYAFSFCSRTHQTLQKVAQGHFNKIVECKVNVIPYNRYLSHLKVSGMNLAFFLCYRAIHTISLRVDHEVIYCSAKYSVLFAISCATKGKLKIKI